MKRLLPILLCLLCFGASVNAQNDGTITTVYPLDYMMPGTQKFTVMPKWTATNSSAQNYTINWRVDNGPVQSWASTPGNLYHYITPIGYKVMSNDTLKVTITTPGTHVFKVWIRVTYPMDNNFANDTFTKIVKVYNYLPPKEVVLETYKHETCGPCYPAANFLHDAMEQKPEFAIVNCYSWFADDIYCIDADTINAAYIPAHPAALYDRFKFPFTSNIYRGYVGAGTIVELEDTAERKKYVEPVDVKFKQVQFDANTRLLKVTLKSKAYDTLNGEYRFNVFLTEDSVKAYQASAPDPNNYYHSDVLRKMLGGSWGAPSSMTSTKLIGGQEYTYEFQYTLPATWKTNKMQIIGLVQKYNASDILDRRILNSTHLDFNKALKLDVPYFAGTPSLNIYPNPANDVFSIVAADLNGQVTVVNSIGQVMKTMTVAHQQELQIQTSEWAAGVYKVIYNSGTSTNSYKVVVIK